MITRRGFLGTLTALVTAPRALFAGHTPTTLGRLTESTYHYKVTFITACGESLPASLSGSPVSASTHRVLYGGTGNGRYVRIGDIPAGVTHANIG